MNPSLGFEIAARLCALAASSGTPVTIGEDGNPECGVGGWLASAILSNRDAVVAYLKGPEIILWRLGSVVVARLPRRDGAAESRAPFMTDGWRLDTEPWRDMASLPTHWNLHTRLEQHS